MAEDRATHRFRTTTLVNLTDYQKAFSIQPANPSLYGQPRQGRGRFTGSTMVTKRYSGSAANRPHQGFHSEDFNLRNDFKRDGTGMRTDGDRHWRPPPERGVGSCPCDGTCCLLQSQHPSSVSYELGRFLGIVAYPVILFLQNRVPHTLSRALYMCAVALYPAYICCKGFRSGESCLLVSWTRYWILLAAFLSIEPLLDDMMGASFPLYAELKLGVLMWMQTSGAAVIFHRLLLPGFDRLQQKMDARAALLQKRAAKMYRTIRKRGFILMTNSLQYVRECCNLADLIPSIDKVDYNDEDDDYSLTGNIWDSEDW